MIPKSKRYRITAIFFFYIATLTVLAIFKGLENLAITGFTVLSGAISIYVWGETKRKSDENI